jgi:hypothetical protein
MPERLRLDSFVSVSLTEIAHYTESWVRKVREYREDVVDPLLTKKMKSHRIPSNSVITAARIMAEEANNLAEERAKQALRVAMEYGDGDDSEGVIDDEEESVDGDERHACEDGDIC